MKVIIAPDKFKGSLSCFDVCEAIEQGLKQAGFTGDIHSFPLADGGDGFSAVLQYYLKTETINCDTVDPLNRKMTASYQWSSKDKTAIVEMAVASGIALLRQNELDPMVTSTYGTGLLIKDALAKGAKKMILGIGGSATNDGGTGILEALGFRFYDKNNQHIEQLSGGKLVQIETIEMPADLPAIEWTVCCDVSNPFYGPNGAAYVYGPQKGADEAKVKLLDDGLKNLAKVLYSATEKDISYVPGAGAAGGIAGGLMAALNASLKQGIDMVLEASNIHSEIHDADLVITGEGKLDDQSLQGKVIGSVAALAVDNGIPCIAFCGRLDLSQKEIEAAGLKAAFIIADNSVPLEESIRNAKRLLQQRAAEVLERFM